MAVILGMFGTVQFRFRYLIFVSTLVTSLQHQCVYEETDVCLCLAVCSMAGPLGGLELIHHLLLSGGWKPVTGKVCVLRLVHVCHALTNFDICPN